jgi:PAS domain S-box-containing protein
VGEAGKPDRTGVWPFAWTLLVLAAVILLGGRFYYTSQEQALRRSVDDQLAAIAGLKVQEIELWRAERITDATHFKDNAAFARVVRSVLARPDDPTVRADFDPWVERMLSGGTYDEIVLVDAQGVERVSLPAKAGPLCDTVRAELPGILRSGATTFVDFHKDDADNKVRIALVQPVREPGIAGVVLGALVFRVDPSPALYPYIQQWPVPSASAETLLVRREGDSAVFLNALRFDPNAALVRRIPMTSTDVPAVKAALGEAGLVSGIDYRGVPVLASVSAVPDSPWFLVAKIDQVEAYAPMTQRLLLTALLVAALLGVATAGVGIAWRQRSSSIYRARWRAERESAWLRDVISRSLNEIYVFDPETLDYSFANTGALGNLGYTQDELATMTPLDIKPDFTPESFEALLAPLRAGEQPDVMFETTHRRKDGSTYPAEVHLQLVDTGERRVFLAIDDDITERRKVDEELRVYREHLEKLVQDRTEELNLSNEELTSMNEELGSTNDELAATNEELTSLNEELAATNEELDVTNADLARTSDDLAAASRAKSEFLASMSHELRTPLNSIIGFSHVMMRGMAGTLTDEQERQLSMINESGTHLLSLINDILDLSRIEAGRLDLKAEELRVGDVARLAVETVRPLAEQRRLELSIDVEDVRQVVHTDSRSVHQVLLNLLGNAIKFTEAGGIVLRARRCGEELRFEVTDTGIGIHPDRLDDIFEEFKQYEQPGYAKPRGTGLGLPVSRRLAARLGGRIEVESTVGVGSVFTLVLPLGEVATHT